MKSNMDRTERVVSTMTLFLLSYATSIALSIAILICLSKDNAEPGRTPTQRSRVKGGMASK
jgi:hypothetical protein